MICNTQLLKGESMKVIISGGWSYGNIGDEVIARATMFLCEKYFAKEEIIYTSYNPEEFFKQHNKKAIKSVHRYWDDVDSENISMYASTDYYIEKLKLQEYEELFDENTLLIMSGGGYFMSPWLNQFFSRILEIEIAKKRGAKVAVIGQSIGPIVGEKNIEIFKSTIEKCDYINVRDKKSYSLIYSILKNKKVNLGADLAIIIDEVFPQYKNKKDKKNVNVTAMGLAKYVSINDIRTSYSIWNKILNVITFKYYRYIYNFKKLITELCNNARVQFILSTKWESYLKFTQKISKRVYKTQYTINSDINVEQMCELIASGSYTISTKLHPIIISSAYGIETVAISYNYKVDEFMNDIDRGAYCYRNTDISAKKILDDYTKRDDKLSDNQKEKIDLMKKNVHSMFADICEL